MSAEGKPRSETSLLGRLLAVVVHLATRSPWLTVAVGVLAVGISLYLSETRLSYHPSRAALLDQREEYHRRWLKYVEEFGEQEDVVVVVQGENRQAIIPALDEIVRELSAQPQYFQAVLHEIDLTRLRDKGLYYLSAQELQTIDGFLNDVEPIIRGGWQYLSPGAMASGMAARLQHAPPEQLQQSISGAQLKLAQLAESLLTALSNPGSYKSPWPELSGSAGPLIGLTSHRLILSNDRIGLVLLKLSKDTSDSFIQNTESITALRQIVDRVRSRHSGVQVGLTGLPIMEHDEMDRSQSSMAVVTILSLVGCFLVLVAGYGGLRHSLMVMAALTMGLIWSLGYITLAVGHLNILSSAFGAILTGLGIDYSIYFVARYLQLRRLRYSLEDALIGTAKTAGPDITVSAACSGLAFLVAGVTEFTGVAEMGLIAGGGIALCLVAALAFLPAIIKIADRGRKAEQLPMPLDFHLWIRPVVTRPALMVGVTLVVTVVLCFGLTRLRYDYNLLNLEPAGLESVALEETLLSESKESVYFALSMAKDPEDAARRKEAFLKLPSVERVDEIATRFPTSLEEKRPIIDRIHNRLAGLPSQPPPIPVASRAELGQMLSALQPVMSANLQMAHFQQQLQGVQSLLGQLPENEYYARLFEYQQRVAGDLLSRLQLLYSVANPEPPNGSELPTGLLSRFVGRKGSHLLRIYVKGDMWDLNNIERFLEQVRSVDPEVTGNPVQIYEASQQMRRSYQHAALYALLAVVPVVFLNFGSFRATLMAGIPLILGMIQSFGLMGLLEIPLNSANMIGLSLMLGMGMENGVFITQDYLGQRGRYRMSPATGVAVMINTLTTMIGYAVLILADHRGLQSLGRMLTLGMSCCLFNAFIFYPAMLVLLSRNREPIADEPPQRQTRPRSFDVGLPSEVYAEEAHPVRLVTPRPTALGRSRGSVSSDSGGENPWEQSY